MLSVAGTKMLPVLRDGDIECYDWALHEITLNGTGIRNLRSRDLRIPCGW